MKTLLRALPYILIVAALYAGWYFWQQRPKQPLAAQLMHLEIDDVKQVSIEPAKGPSFQFGRVENGWLVSSGHYHRLEASQRPNQLLQTLLQMRSIDVVPAPLSTALVAHIEINKKEASYNSFDLFLAPDSVDYQAIVRFGNQPDYFALADFDPLALPLAFSNYRSYELLDLTSYQGLDSLAWVGADSSSYHWLQATDSLQLDSIYQEWEQLLGRNFADYFDEIGDQPDWYGSYHLYGPNDSTELRVYHDSLWPQPYVLSSIQFPKAFFGVDSLPLIIDTLQ